jgi:hypothetical protein
MRVMCALLAVLVGGPAQAQIPPPLIGPILSEKSVNASAFDAAFEVQVTLVPAAPLLLGQTPDARFDAVVCNASASGAGWAKVDPKARWGVLEPGQCTMFSNFGQLDLTTPGDNREWTAKVFLRARK